MQYTIPYLKLYCYTTSYPTSYFKSYVVHTKLSYNIIYMRKVKSNANEAVLLQAILHTLLYPTRYTIPPTHTPTTHPHAGKTMLMDLFYESCRANSEATYKRVHFHAFMLDIHKR